MVSGLLLAESLAESFVLFLHHLFAYFDGIVGDGDIFVELDVESGSEGEVIFKSEVALVFEIEFDHFNGHGVAEHFKLVVVDIIDDCLVDGLVDHVAGNLLAKSALEVGHRYVSLAEAGDGVGLAYLLEVFFYFSFIVGGGDLYSESTTYFRRLLHAYVHGDRFILKK